jgi:hypothetical protein
VIGPLSRRERAGNRVVQRDRGSKTRPLFIDVDYYDLRERDYPLLAPAQMAERLPNPGFEFAIYYKRRS